MHQELLAQAHVFYNALRIIRTCLMNSSWNTRKNNDAKGLVSETALTLLRCLIYVTVKVINPVMFYNHRINHFYRNIKIYTSRFTFSDRLIIGCVLSECLIS